MSLRLPNKNGEVARGRLPRLLQCRLTSLRQERWVPQPEPRVPPPAQELQLGPPKPQEQQREQRREQRGDEGKGQHENPDDAAASAQDEV